MIRMIGRHSFYHILRLICIIFALVSLTVYSRLSLPEHFWTIARSNIDRDRSCHLPDPDFIDPFDKTIIPLITDYGSYVSCKKANSLVVSTVNDSGVLSVRYKEKNITCVYQTFRRDGDSKVLFDEKIRIKSGQLIDLNEIKQQFVSVECARKSKLIHKKVHSFPSFPIETTNISGRADHKQYNVFLLVIESLSRVNYNRFLKKTDAVLKKINSTRATNMFDLKGLVKVGDNSYPNMVPFLTGRKAYTTETDENWNTTATFDELDLIFKKFKRNGYITSFIEEAPHITLFNYMAEGFIEQPTDWYPRPFWIEAYKDRKKYCYHDEALVDTFLRQGRQFSERCIRENKPSFTFSFYIALTHDDFNRVKQLDDHLSKFIEDFKNLENTLFILMGDHGQRYGAIVETDIGYIEERMPYFSILIPNGLLAEYPSIGYDLQRNERRLTTWYDVHRMLEDVADGAYTELPPTLFDNTKLAYSLWREPVPLSRTCSDANIEETYCMCDKRTSISVKTPVVKLAANELIKSVNKLLSGFADICALLYLDEIIGANVIHSMDEKDTIEVLLSAKPSGAKFRAKMEKTHGIDDWVLKGDVTRVNEYGDQSICIGVKQLKPLCFCIAYELSTSH